MNCIICNNVLSGRQKRFCSNKCKNKNYFKTGNLVNFQKRMAYNRKIELVNMFGGKCQKCGYNKCLRALSFHHINRSTKNFALGQHVLQSKNWEQILDEAKKCQLLCLNCHAEIHSQEDETYIFDESNLKPYKHMEQLKKESIKCKFCDTAFVNHKSQTKFCGEECRNNFFSKRRT